MKHIAGGLVVLLLLVGLAGCNTLARRPQLKNATLAPSELKPGESAVLSVEVRDRHDVVRKVEGAVREDPSIKFKLHDDGQMPDRKPGDHTWSLQVDVPFQAPAGNYTFDLTAYRSDGTPVPVRAHGKTAPLTATLPVIIKTP